MSHQSRTIAARVATRGSARLKTLIAGGVLVVGLTASFGGSPAGARTTGAGASTAATNADTCGYPTGTTGKPATVFNENTLAELIQVNGSGTTATVSAYADDENSIILGVTDPSSSATVTPFYPTASLASAIAANTQYTSISVTGLTFNITSGDHLQIGPQGGPNPQATANVSAQGGTVSIPVQQFNVDQNHTQAVGAPVVDVNTEQNVTTEHAHNPSLGDLSLLDASGRPQYPAIFVTNLTTDGTSSMAGDWQQGGSPQANVNDVFGTWVTGTYVNNNNQLQYQKPQPPQNKNNDTFGPGSDAPQSALPMSQGYGTEFRWNVSSLLDDHGHALVAGDNYRFQVILHDGDQNQSGGDVGELCTTLSLPPPPVGTLQADTFNCNNDVQTTTEQPGGSVSLTSGASSPQTKTETATGATFTGLTPDNYGVQATAPSGFEFITCGSPNYTISNNGSTATYNSPVNVPAGGTGNAVFYVVPIPGTLVANIYNCNNGSQTTTEQPGGTVTITPPSGPNQTGTDTGSGVTFGNLASGNYGVSATAPSGFEFVTCSSTNYSTSGNPPTNASYTNPVFVPQGGTGHAIFYVVPLPGTVTFVTQTMDSCREALGGATWTLSLGGSLIATQTAAPGGPSSVGSSKTCPLQHGNCVTAPQIGCLTWMLTEPSSGTLTYTLKVTAAPSGYFTCDSGSACQSEIMSVVVDSSGNIKATTTNIQGDGTPQTFPSSDPNNGGKAFWSGTAADPALIYLEKHGTKSCDGDNDADDMANGVNGHCDNDAD